MRARSVVAAVLALAAPPAALAADPPGHGKPAPHWAYVPPAATQLARGRQLYVTGCSTCHGLDARGVPDVAPSLHGAGEAGAWFYLSTGRMPLQDEPGKQPERAPPAYPPDEIDSIVAYVGSFGGPRIEHPDVAGGDVERGFRLYTDFCAGCHQIAGEGGALPGAKPPPLNESTPDQIAAAIRIGPYVMPKFGAATLDDRDVRDITAYVVREAQHEQDPGGWGIGHIGPVPEGMVTVFIGLTVLLIAVRVIGERTTE